MDQSPQPSTSDDLTRLLASWPYVPGQLSVRLIEGDDGEPKIQMRVNLGVLQMEVSGRPDGQRPDGYESLLERCEDELDDAGAESLDEEEEAPADFSLDNETCRLLREEASQYYHRYVALFILEEYAGVVRDTSRNLRVLDLCRDYAERDEDREALEQFRPYLLTMRARALASQAVRDDEPKAAMLAIDDALDQISRFFQQRGEPESFEEASEVQLLRGMREALVPKLPMSPKSELRDRLRQAVEQENYELAAILRDELRNMKE
jgi:hypothetical protein